MALNDILQFFIISVSLFGIIAWARRLRHWPLALAAALALASNVFFLIIRSAGFWTSNDLNQLSLTRILLLTIVVAVVPFSILDQHK